jgi:hypothetical protein
MSADDNSVTIDIRLLGKPLGFTQDDVNRLHEMIEWLSSEDAEWCRSLRDRIAAILPLP